jgi:hypothetical protein
MMGDRVIFYIRDYTQAFDEIDFVPNELGHDESL